MSRNKINKIFTIFSQDNPHPKTELEYINDYTLLVAVVLSAQSTDIGVNKATKALFKVVDNPYDMVELGEEKLKKYSKFIIHPNELYINNIVYLNCSLTNSYKQIITENLIKKALTAESEDVNQIF